MSFFSFNPVSWFLSSLVFCYFVISLVLMRPRVLFPIAFAGSLLSVILSALYIQQQSPPDTNLIAWLMYIFPPNRLFNVLCGMGVGYLFLKLQRSRTAGKVTIFWTIIEFVALGLFLERIFYKGITKIAFGQFLPLFSSVSHSANQLFENYIMCPFLIIGLLLVFVFRAGFLSGLLERRPFIVLGKVSLALYMSHQLVFRFLAFVKNAFVVRFGEAGFALVACAGAIFLAAILHVMVEKPGKKILVNPRQELPLLKAKIQRWFYCLTKDIFEDRTPIKTIKSLNALRFFGMLVVMLHHIDFLLGWQPVVGLNFILTYFFTFSGFAVYLGFRRFHRAREMVVFVWNRLARIYPVYVVTFLVGAWLMYLEGSSATFSTALLNLAMVQSWFRSEKIFFFFQCGGMVRVNATFLVYFFCRHPGQAGAPFLWSVTPCLRIGGYNCHPP